MVHRPVAMANVEEDTTAINEEEDYVVVDLHQKVTKLKNDIVDHVQTQKQSLLVIKEKAEDVKISVVQGNFCKGTASELRSNIALEKKTQEATQKLLEPEMNECLNGDLPPVLNEIVQAIQDKSMEMLDCNEELCKVEIEVSQILSSRNRTLPFYQETFFHFLRVIQENFRKCCML